MKVWRNHIEVVEPEKLLQSLINNLKDEIDFLESLSNLPLIEQLKALQDAEYCYVDKED